MRGNSGASSNEEIYLLMSWLVTGENSLKGK